MTTKKQINDSLPTTGRGTWTDPATPGLQLQGNRKGASWYLRHRVGGKRVRDTLGRWPGLDLKGARAAAQVAIERAAVASAAGVDLLADRKARQEADRRRRAALSLSDALDLYRDDRLVELKSGKHAESTIRLVFAPLLGRSLADLTADDVRAAYQAKRRQARASADTGLRYVRPFFKWIAENKHGDNLTADLKAPQTRKRDRTLSLSELGKVIVAIESLDDMGGIVARALVASPGRLRELTDMRLDEVQGDTWHLPADRNKSGTAHVIPLNTYAQEAIAAGRARNTGSDYVFEGKTGQTPYHVGSKLINAVRSASGVTDWTWHDLRRTFATICADRGVDPLVADRCLNHVGSGSLSTVARVYQRSQFLDQRRAAMAIWDDVIREVAARERSENVVSLQVSN